jgi:type I protein arginine methyltransferase
MSRGEYGIDTFGQLIADPVRTGAYTEALRRAVKPGSVVVDIGTGTGILALLACRFGARRVHAIEPDPIVATAREVAAANGYADRIVFHEAVSTEVDLGERADVIVSDLYGVLPFHRARIPALADARARFLAPGGLMIPRRDHVWLAAASASRLQRVVSTPWVEGSLGFDMTAARDIASNQWRRAVLQPEELATAPVRIATLDYASDAEASLRARIESRFDHAAEVHGLCAWFDAEFADGIGFSNAPGAPATIYGSAFFPWPEPVSVSAGDGLQADLRAQLVSGQYVWSWTSEVRRAGASAAHVRFDQSTFFGMPLARTGLDRIAAAHAPGLGVAGSVDRVALEAMASGATLEAIARRLRSEFPARFAREEDALAHAGELSVRYGR